MAETSELMILVDEDDREIGIADKLETHRRGALHRAISVIVWDSAGRLLLQKRAAGKYHSGGSWTNACCGHPRPGEDVEDAALRRPTGMVLIVSSTISGKPGVAAARCSMPSSPIRWMVPLSAPRCRTTAASASPSEAAPARRVSITIAPKPSTVVSPPIRHSTCRPGPHATLSACQATAMFARK
jgi:hypothetical protein